ncbi:MAG: signal peptidase II [Planctomycetota bacterium]
MDIQKCRIFIQLFIVSCVATIIDQLSKKTVFEFLEKTEHGEIMLIPKIVNFEYVTNTGGFWGVLRGHNKIITIINIIVFPLLFVIFKKFIFISWWQRLGLGLIIGGALGNILDRIFLGYVRDFVHLIFIPWPVFNGADIFISLGAIIMLLSLLKEKG